MSIALNEGEDGNSGPKLVRTPSGKSWSSKFKTLLGGKSSSRERASSTEDRSDVLNRELTFLGLSEDTAGPTEKTSEGSNDASPSTLPSPLIVSPRSSSSTPTFSSSEARSPTSPSPSTQPSPTRGSLVPPPLPAFGATRNSVSEPTENVLSSTPTAPGTPSLAPSEDPSIARSSTSTNETPDAVERPILRESPSWVEGGVLDAKVNEQRLRIVNELLSTEDTYVNSLQIIFNDYYKPLRAASLFYGVTRQQVASIFSCFEALMVFHQSFLTELQKEAEVAQQGSLAPIWALFLKQVDYLKMYSTYMTNYPKAAQVISQLKDQSKFQGLLTRNREKRGLDLMSYLIMPVQRIPRYELLLREVMKCTPRGHPEYSSLSTLFSKVQQIAGSINEGQRQMENMSKLLEIQNRMTGGITLMSPGRNLIRDGPLTKFASGFLGTQSSHTRLFFLFNDKLLWTTTKYEYRGHVELLGATLTEVEASKNAQPKSPGRSLLDLDPPATSPPPKSPSKRFGTLGKDFKLSQALTVDTAAPQTPNRAGGDGSLKVGLSPRMSARLSLTASNGIVPSLRIEGLIATKGDTETDTEKFLLITASSQGEHEAWKADLESAIKVHCTTVAANKDRRTSLGVTTTILGGEEKSRESAEVSEAEKSAAAAGVSKQLIAATRGSPRRELRKAPSSSTLRASKSPSPSPAPSGRKMSM